MDELREAIFLAEEACPGISDSMVTELVQRLQRYDSWIKVLQHLHRFKSYSSNRVLNLVYIQLKLLNYRMLCILLLYFFFKLIYFIFGGGNSR